MTGADFKTISIALCPFDDFAALRNFLRSSATLKSCSRRQNCEQSA